MARQVATEHYAEEYDSIRRFCSYWTQIEEILGVTPRGGSVLEVGKGTGLTSWYLERAGLHVSTVDNDPGLRPTFAADLRQLPVSDGAFDTVVAFQVLEHLPFQYFRHALEELSRVAKENVIVSLPDNSSKIAISAALPRNRRVRKVWTLPFRPKRNVLVKHQHFWELGVAGYPVERIRSEISAARLAISKQFRLPENPFHHFFVLRKT